MAQPLPLRHVASSSPAPGGAIPVTIYDLPSGGGEGSDIPSGTERQVLGYDSDGKPTPVTIGWGQLSDQQNPPPFDNGVLTMAKNPITGDDEFGLFEIAVDSGFHAIPKKNALASYDFETGGLPVQTPVSPSDATPKSYVDAAVSRIAPTDGAVGSKIFFNSAVTKTAPAYIDAGTFKVRVLSGQRNAPYPTIYAASGSKFMDAGSSSIGIPPGSILSTSLKSVYRQAISSTTGYDLMDSGAYGSGMFRDSDTGEAWTITMLAPPSSPDATPSAFTAVLERVS